MAERADGGVVTIADVVCQLSPYSQANDEDIMWVVGPTIQLNPLLRPDQDIPADMPPFCGSFLPEILHG